MSPHPAGILVLGYGNPGRMDDGLGPLFAEAVEKLGIDGVTVEANYQLTVEDAAIIAEHEVVVFVDAAIEGPEPFTLERARPDSAMSFSTHSVTPPALLELARDFSDRMWRVTFWASGVTSSTGSVKVFPCKRRAT